jgi:tripartite-type tricarboxylate transporter receptor subunit TctC
LKDFAPIVPLTSQPYVLVTGKPAGVATVGELIAAARAKPGKLAFGSSGIGTGTHLGVEKFNLAERTGRQPAQLDYVRAFVRPAAQRQVVSWRRSR